ncbi:MAG: hypothetical protein ACTSUB_00770 [Candidatus Thorarchaeota archaeon]
MIPELVDAMDWKIIESQLDQDFGNGTSNILLGNQAPVLVMRGKTKSFYLIPSKWMQIIGEGFEGFDIRFLGQWLGELINEQFKPSLPIIEKLAKFTDRKMIVSSRGAQAFTYGRSILKESVVTLNQSLKRGQKVIVLNETEDVLGLGSLSVDAYLVSRLAKDKLVAKNRVDIGWYLRRIG